MTSRAGVAKLYSHAEGVILPPVSNIRVHPCHKLYFFTPKACQNLWQCIRAADAVTLKLLSEAKLRDIHIKKAGTRELVPGKV
jgi:hypothetical protein